MEQVNLFRLFNISIDSNDIEIEKNYMKLKQDINSEKEQQELLKNYNKISSKEMRYLYSLTSIQGFQDISELDREIVSRPNYVGPRQWLELL